MGAQKNWKLVSPAEPCKICNTGDWCQTSADGSVAMCMRVGDGAFKTSNTASGSIAYFHWLVPREERKKARAVTAEPTGELADIDIRHAVYCALLSELQLSETHRQDLLRRKAPLPFTERGYKTIPSKSWKVVSKLRQTFSDDVLLKVPGFVVKKNRKGEPYLTINAQPGMTVPVRDENGKITAMKVRADNAVKERKYTWLSSKRFGGPGPGTPAHCPIGVKGPVDVLRIAEGPLKADVAAALNCIPTIGADSATNWKSAVSLAKALGARTARLAWDDDALTNSNVALGLSKCAAALQDEGITVEIETWDTDHKGVDDLLADGGTPRVIAGEHATEFLTALAAKCRLDDDAAVSDFNTGRPVIRVDPSIMQVGDTLHKVTDRLLAAGNCFNRAQQLVAINDLQIHTILSAPELAGLLNQHVEFYFINKDAGEFKPFPPAYANTWLNHDIEQSRLPLIKLYSRNPVYTDDWRLVAPGFDRPSGIYYAGTAVQPLTETPRLDVLLREFCFRRPTDRTNYVGVLLTTILMPRFIGSKPAALFNGNQPELGKSILAQIISILRDGEPAETATYNPNDEEFEKRLGAIVRRGSTTIIIDNAKARGRNARIDSPCLERSITDPILSFRLLGQSDSIRAENSHIFCITANAPDVSRDLVTRSVVINLYYEGDPEKRAFSIADPEGYALKYRIEILGELVGLVERWKASGMPLAKTHSRFNKRGWGNIVGGILEACGEPDFMANAEEAVAQLDETHREFAELVDILADHPQGVWTSTELVELCGKHKLLSTDLGDGSERSQSTKMGTTAGRFIGDCFSLSDGRQATFLRLTDRKGNVYRVSVVEAVPNLGTVAEPMPNLVSVAGSAL